MKYFAYGSNMLTERLRARVSDASPLSEVSIGGYLLRFHKKSTDGSGKCNIVKTGSDKDRIHGVIFEIPREQLEKLDEAEGYGNGYDHEYIPLPDRPDESALAYVAEPKYIDDRLLPYKWYHELVIAGAEQHGLSPDYIAELRNQDWKEDPRPDRPSKLEAEKLLNREKRHRGLHRFVHERLLCASRSRSRGRGSAKDQVQELFSIGTASYQICDGVTSF
jgi:AIG2-like family